MLINKIFDERVPFGNKKPTFEQKPAKPQVILKSPASRGLIGFNVYRDAQKINEDYIQTTTFLDEDLPAGTYQYYVTSVFNTGESDPGNIVSVSVGVLSQSFTLTSGWNSISSRLTPVNTDIEIICNPVIDDFQVFLILLRLDKESLG